MLVLRARCSVQKMSRIDSAAPRPHLSRMRSIAEIAAALEGVAWAAALPGRLTAERDSVLRELHRLLQAVSACP